MDRHKGGHMISQLIEKIQKTKAPVCVGLDPMLSYIPECIVKKALGEWGDRVHKRGVKVFDPTLLTPVCLILFPKLRIPLPHVL